MYKNSGFLKSIKNAVRGYIFALMTERNLRFHTSIAILICTFAYFYGLAKCEWAVLLLTILFVLSAECFNTAIEHTVDTATAEICESAKNAKDVSAAATLLCAIFAVLVGIFLFGDTKKILLALTLLIKTAFSGIFEFLILFGILILNIWLLFFCSRKKGQKYDK